MNKKFREYLASLNKKALFTFDEILQRMQLFLDNRINISSEEMSGYIDAFIDNEYPRQFITWRISSHLPKLQNIIKHHPHDIIADKPYGHMTVLMMGTNEANMLGQIVRSEYNSHSMSKDKVTVKVKVSHATFDYYKSELPKEIAYHVYHFITDLISENDLKLIAQSTKYWLKNKGDASFNISNELTQYVYYKDKKSKFSSIDCHMIIKRATIDENVYLISGAVPVLSFDMGYVTLISPDNEELTICGVLEINKCLDISYNALIGSELETTAKRNKKKTLKEMQQQLYDSAIKRAKEIIQEELEKRKE